MPNSPEYMRDYRDRNRARLAYLRAQQREEWRRRLLDITGEGKCKDCGETDYRVLVFDHLRDKTANVSVFLTRSWKKALAEAAKCEVVCSNCHAIRTYERRPKPESVELAPWLTLSKTHCPQGHIKSEENTYYHKGNKLCLECKRINSREWYRKNKRKK